MTRVVFCIPGNNFSNNFLISWTNLLSWCFHNGIEPLLCNRYTSNVYYVRSQCLQANVLAGINQKPFQGKLKYDYIMWIDSDIVFKPEHFKRLLTHNADVISGTYLMTGGTHFPIVEDWDEEYFKSNGSFKFITPDELKKKNDVFQVSYNGMGFMLIKQGVIEKITYPYFEPEFTTFNNGITDFASEDVSFCRKLTKAGVKILVDPSVIVGHEKSIIYFPT